MKKRIEHNTDNKLAVSREELQELLGVGRDTAMKIGIEAKAKFKVGARALYNVAKIQAYIDSLSDNMGA